MKTRLPMMIIICLMLSHFSVAEKKPNLSKKKAHPFFAFCMDVHDSKKRTLAQQAQLLKELGYDGLGHLWLKKIPERLETLDAANLKLFQIYVRVNIAPDSKRLYDPQLKKIIPLLKGRGTDLALLISGLKPSDPAGDPRAVAVVREIADLAHEYGLRVVLYHHTGDWLERVEDAVRLAQKVNRRNVGVMFNLCHWLKVDREANMEQVLSLARPYLFAVSIHGADKASQIQAGKGNWIQPLGSGSFDVYHLLETLKDLDYQGPIGLQCFGLRGDARNHLTRSIATWRALCKRLNSQQTPK